ncbi:MAG TPA: hypothetical protein PKU69_05685, partial [Bacillota bacterium]|nr:hypothetical protein [Bacillota bacterium]
MNEYRKTNRLTDEQISQFRSEEIASILDKNTEQKPSFFFNKRFVLSTGLLLMMLVSLGLFLFTKNDDTFNIIQINAQEYLVENIEEDASNYVYYKAYIVYENPLVTYDDTFSYRRDYRYVPEEIASTVSVAFDSFRLDKYRIFIEITVDGETLYGEVDFFPGLTKDFFLEDMEIDDYEQDMNDVFQMIAMYPPVYMGIGDTGLPEYGINDQVNDLPDSKTKRNYIQYVTTIYDDPTNYSPIGDPDAISVYTYHDLIVLDSENQIIDKSLHVYIQSATPEMKECIVVHDTSEILDYVNSNFSFYYDGGTTPGMTMS